MAYIEDKDTIRELIGELTDTDILWVDTEVADWNTSHPRLSLIQVLAFPHDETGNRTYILDVLDRGDLVELFIEKIMANENIKKVIHNASYDLQFLGNRRAKNVFCTLELARKIPYHLLPVESKSLKSLTLFLTDFKEVDKQQQSSDWGKRPLREEQIKYAEMDCVYLAHVYSRLLEIKKNGRI